MNEDFIGKFSYQDLRQIIFDYFKKNQGIELSSISIDYLRDKLARDTVNQPFFIIDNEFGESRFDISKEDIQKIFSSYLASKNYVLTDLKYGNEVGFNYYPNLSKKNINQEKVDLDLTFNGEIDYSFLRQIIFDYYKENRGIELSSISIDYLRDKLARGTVDQPFFIINNEFGESRFDISKEDIQKIFSSYLASKNYELTDLNFGSMVEFRYKQGKNKEKEIEQEKTGSDAQINEFGEITRSSRDEYFSPNGNVPYFEPPKEEKVELKKQDTPQLTSKNSQDELTHMAKEQRKFTILQRERAMNDAQRAKNRSAIMAGICILGASAATYFNGQDVHQILQHELNAIYSWEALGQFIQDLGPLATLLTAGAAGFIAKYLKHSKKLKQAQNEFIGFNNSLEKTEELGGNENAKSR